MKVDGNPATTELVVVAVGGSAKVLLRVVGVPDLSLLRLFRLLLLLLLLLVYTTWFEGPAAVLLVPGILSISESDTMGVAENRRGARTRSGKLS